MRVLRYLQNKVTWVDWSYAILISQQRALCIKGMHLRSSSPFLIFEGKSAYLLRIYIITYSVAHKVQHFVIQHIYCKKKRKG